MSEEIMKKLKEHDVEFVNISKKFLGIDEKLIKIDERFDKMDEQIDTLACNVADHTVRLDAIADTLVGHSERLDRIEENMATKADMAKIMDTLDTIVGIVKKNDQEMVFMGERMNRVERDVEIIKPLVGLAV